ncbi:MAG: undecaprenyl-diphosphate phosphatase [Bacteroidales bacterium]
MDILKSVILGIIQGLTEFLPVSSSGHLELAKSLLGVKLEDNLTFNLVVHLATVLSTIIVFRKDITNLFIGLFKFEMNTETKMVINILVSLIPLVPVYFLFNDRLDEFLDRSVTPEHQIVMFVGICLLITALILFVSTRMKKTDNDASASIDTTKKIDNDVTLFKAFIIGIAQALAVLPGVSRSGSTIATGLILKVDKAKVTRFSFLMVIPAILGAMLLDVIELSTSPSGVAHMDTIPLIAGFIGALISGIFACRWMVKLVQKGSLIYFAIYCLAIGLIAIIASFVMQ